MRPRPMAWVLLVLAFACTSQDTPSAAHRSEANAPARAAPSETTAPRTEAEPAGGSAPTRLATVTHVTDGDTIRVLIDGRRERVRYIGIDTPETRHSRRGPQPFADEATEANRRLVAGRQVRLVLDASERDRYGRLLAYVYLRDGTFVNARLVEEGFARVLTVPPNVRHAALFRKLEARARRSGRGLWALTPTR